MQIIERKQVIPTDILAAWSFFSDPGNLGIITPPDMDFTILSRSGSGPVYPGMMITYRVRPVMGIPVQWVTEISHVKEPLYFADVQVKGPYRFWQHQHWFREVSKGVEVTDIVHYLLPFGWIGRKLGSGMVNRRLTGIFEYRSRVLTERFGILS
ncbi:MAG: SRPBCC family protein [Bacteroidales bacterium]|nr:SRPBCC family protein [Bacteroidales bacterium]